MATVTLEGKTVSTCGTLPQKGDKAPDFSLVRWSDLAEVSRKDYAGRQLLLNIFPSIDTQVCALTVRRFNQEAAARPKLQVLCVSADLPFALSRFCTTEGLRCVEALSAFLDPFRKPAFGEDYGVRMTSGPLTGLLSRAVLALDEEGTVLHAEQVPEITHEPNYDAAFAAFR